MQGLSTSAIAQPAVLSALQRKVREGQLTAAEAWRRVLRVAPHFTWRYRLLTSTPGVLPQACALVQAYPLRADDALPQACALAARQRLHARMGLSGSSPYDSMLAS